MATETPLQFVNNFLNALNFMQGVPANLCTGCWCFVFAAGKHTSRKFKSNGMTEWGHGYSLSILSISKPFAGTVPENNSCINPE